MSTVKRELKLTRIINAPRELMTMVKLDIAKLQEAYDN